MNPLLLKATVAHYVTDLYVMQNEHGLIKVGHSINPEQRRQILEIQERCRIRIVLVLREKGHREKSIHGKLTNYNIGGEWFEGSKESKRAIANAIKRWPFPEWPYELNQSAADVWLKEFETRRETSRETNYAPRRVSELVNRIRRVRKSGALVDAEIWEIIMTIEDKFLLVAVNTNEDTDETVLDGYTSDSDLPIRIPHYSSDFDAAMSLWPKHIRPNCWNGTAFECCLAAIEAHWQIWRDSRKEKS